jgi:protein involved in polysaccharide export with SLBB domain
MKMAYRTSGVICAVLIALAFSAHGQESQPVATPIPMPAQPAGENYVITPNDLISVKVFQEDDLESNLRVSRDGTVTFPLIGVVKIGGMSTQQAATAIRDRLAAEYLVNPQVTLTVVEYSKRRFTVLGNVQKPGSYELPDRDTFTLLEAIGVAGGYTRIGNPAKITLKRIRDGRQEVKHLDAGEMARDKGDAAFRIQPGDVITVGERFF